MAFISTIRNTFVPAPILSLISGLPHMCKLLTTNKYPNKLLSWQPICGTGMMEETANSTAGRTCLVKRYPSESVAIADLITDMMGLKIRIPARIWNNYEPTTSPERHSPPGRTGLKVKIPEHIWNAYHPSTPLHKTNNAPRKLTLKLRCLSLPPPRQNRKVKQTKRRASGDAPTSCKVKLFRFHYGGPKRQQKGKWQNTVTYEQPCLQLTCKSCWRWHGHILREGMSMEGQ